MPPCSPCSVYEEACKDQKRRRAGRWLRRPGFTGLLLHGSLSQDTRPAARDNAAEAGDQEHETEEEKNYWNSILNLVNSSASVVVPAYEAYSPAPEF
ncbi:hypothetical protein ZWY2020_029204 [Hordeum vulgare]|nr:hypothetical protein ZWY2020_029204 [Hordeum vulgare]